MRYIMVLMMLVLVGCGGQSREQHSTAHHNLPPGYTIQTDGAQYRWVDEDGSAAVFSDTSYESAVDHAWEFYEYQEYKKTHPWRNVTEEASK